MPQVTLEQRVAALEKKITEMQAQHTNGAPEKHWLRGLGMFSGDAVMKEIFDEALKFREKDRARARRRNASKPAARRVKK